MWSRKCGVENVESEMVGEVGNVKLEIKSKSQKTVGRETQKRKLKGKVGKESWKRKLVTAGSGRGVGSKLVVK